MRGKPRGSVIGLLKHRDDQRDQNTSAMLEVIQILHSEKPNTKWTYKDIWSRAGLRSPNSLASPWNAHIRAEIDSHNQLVSISTSERPCAGLTKAERDVAGRLREELKVCKAQRDDALALIAQFAADADFFKKQCDDLKKTVARLKKPSIGQPR
jgi:hypothetical protein